MLVLSFSHTQCAMAGGTSRRRYKKAMILRTSAFDLPRDTATRRWLARFDHIENESVLSQNVRPKTAIFVSVQRKLRY